MKLPSNLGMILLAAWLIVFGLLTTSLLNIPLSSRNDILALFAIVVGVVLLVRR
ncbi:MAG: hypothetical protein ACJ8F7_03625 [Gemmataceae bacterium]